MSSPPPDPRPWTTHDANITLHQCLSTSTLTRRALPSEIILQILDHPTRWIYVHSVNCSNQGHQPVNGQILATDPISAYSVARLRSIVYSFQSQDQGWSSYTEHHGTYDASWTWFEAGLTRFAEQIPEQEDSTREQELRAEKERERYELQRNRHAGREPEDYRIELDRDHELLRRVEDGDRLALWARAMFPGWKNWVHHARIDVLGVDNLMEDGSFRQRV